MDQIPQETETSTLPVLRVGRNPEEVVIVDQVSGAVVDLVPNLIALDVSLTGEGCVAHITTRVDLEFEFPIHRLILQGPAVEFTAAQYDEILASGGMSRSPGQKIVDAHQREAT